MFDSPKLTARQQQILTLIQTTIEKTGSPPTRAEIATEFGFKSANAAEEHLQALHRKGAIELLQGTSRGIRLRGDTLRAIHENRSKQFGLPLQSLMQLALPLIGRVAAGSPSSRKSTLIKRITSSPACSPPSLITCSKCAA